MFRITAIDLKLNKNGQQIFDKIHYFKITNSKSMELVSALALDRQIEELENKCQENRNTSKRLTMTDGSCFDSTLILDILDWVESKWTRIKTTSTLLHSSINPIIDRVSNHLTYSKLNVDVIATAVLNTFSTQNAFACLLAYVFMF